MKEKLPGPYEPKMRNRFTIEFPEELNIPAYVLKSVTRPLFMLGNWEPIQIKLYDPIGPSTSQAVHELILRQQEAEYGEDVFFQFHINTLDPVGVVIEKWEIDVSHIYDVDFGEMNNLISSPCIITMRLVPKKCVLLY